MRRRSAAADLRRQPDTALHALRDIAKHTRGGDADPLAGRRLRRRRRGRAASRATTSASRTASPTPTSATPPSPGGCCGSPPVSASRAGRPAARYHVCRIIRMLVEFWDRVALTEQQQMIGRYRDTGAPLGQAHEDAIPDYRRDPHGHRIPLSAHIRLANPRTARRPSTAGSTPRLQLRPRRRPQRQPRHGPGLQRFQQNIRRQFEATQLRLVGEPMVDYMTPGRRRLLLRAAGRPRTGRLVRPRATGTMSSRVPAASAR